MSIRTRATYSGKTCPCAGTLAANACRARGAANTANAVASSTCSLTFQTGRRARAHEAAANAIRSPACAQQAMSGTIA